jgi:hypothetical protein
LPGDGALTEVAKCGITADAIAAQAPPALSTNAINVLLGEANFWVPGTIAEQVLAIEIPPNT